MQDAYDAVVKAQSAALAGWNGAPVGTQTDETSELLALPRSQPMQSDGGLDRDQGRLIPKRRLTQATTYRLHQAAQELRRSRNFPQRFLFDAV